jgi:sugar/nucleoside kinase (ribokinase family)
MSVLAAIGNLSLDRMADAPPRPGGTVFFSARALALLQSDAHVGASCAAAQRPLLAQLEAFGLPVTWYEAEATTGFSFRYARSGQRTMRLESVGKRWLPDDALDAAGDASWVHVGALIRTDFPRATLSALAGEGRRLLVDGQGLLRSPTIGPLRRDRGIGDVLRYVTILKLDEDEAALLVGGLEPERLHMLGVPEVLVTLGAKGAYVVTNRGIESVPAKEILGPVDPTGAGDTFSAGYLAARSAGADPTEAARAATDAVAAFLSGT